ncbi:Nucleic acid-binding, OB-fold [Phytophthora cactorum]|nr:Nucleic acid-binding, OB-fold [Phytophthora cactorum]
MGSLCLPFDAASFIERISILKRNITGAPFEQCFEALRTAMPARSAQFRSRTVVTRRFTCSLKQTVSSLCTRFASRTRPTRPSREFVDTRRTVNNAPPVAFGKDPPLELRGAPVCATRLTCLAIFPTHVDTTEKRIKASTLVQGLRNYLHYHIKASKTYLHIRMRKRVDLLLQAFSASHSRKNVPLTPMSRTASRGAAPWPPQDDEGLAATAGGETTWNTLVVGEIVDFHPHPQADRLNVCAVNIGDKDNLLQIICGAPNVRQGARVPVAKVGTRLAIKERETGELKKLKIKKSKLRGEISQGMICSEAELGLTDESSGILIFEDDAEVGDLVSEYGTIANRLKARGISIPTPQPKATAAAVHPEPTQE